MFYVSNHQHIHIFLRKTVKMIDQANLSKEYLFLIVCTVCVCIYERDNKVTPLQQNKVHLSALSIGSSIITVIKDIPIAL